MAIHKPSKAVEATTGDVRPEPEQRVRQPRVKSQIEWKRLEYNPRRNAIVIIQGPDQSGKTHWAFTAPAPIAVLTFDPDNFDGVAKKFAADKEIHMVSFEIPKGLFPTNELAKIAEREAGRYEDHFIDACKSDYFRTIITDREDEAWELFRYEEFDGKGSAKSHHYVRLNTAYRAMLKTAHQNRKNLIMIDAVSAEYKANTPTGGMKRDGFKHLGMLSQVTLEAQVDNYDNFALQVIKCRDDATKNGVLLEPKGLSAALVEAGYPYPEDEAGNQYLHSIEFANVMSYLIGGSPDEWK